MPNPADYSDPRASLIDDLLARQDEVIQQLDELDKRLIATIEKIHPAKVEGEEAPVEEVPAKKAA